MPFNPDTDLVAQWEDLVIFQNKDADLTITLTDPVTGLPYNLTGITVSLTRKPNRDTPDAAGKSYSCTVQGSPTAGVVTVRLPASDNFAPGVSWYRIDLTGAETKAVKFGRLTNFAV